LEPGRLTLPRAERLRDRAPRLRTSICQRRLVGELVRDLCIAEEELLLLQLAGERRLPQKEDRDVGGDDRDREPRGPAGRVDVADRDHEVLLSRPDHDQRTTIRGSTGVSSASSKH
jgi:hypothetical protein